VSTERPLYWRSLGELAGTPEFRTALEREFPEGAADPPDGITRRTMLALMGSPPAGVRSRRSFRT